MSTSPARSNVIPFRPRHEPWQTKAQLARHLGRSERWIELRIRDADLPVHKFMDRSVRFHFSEVDDWLKGREVA